MAKYEVGIQIGVKLFIAIIDPPELNALKREEIDNDLIPILLQCDNYLLLEDFDGIPDNKVHILCEKVLTQEEVKEEKTTKISNKSKTVNLAMNCEIKWKIIYFQASAIENNTTLEAEELIANSRSNLPKQALDQLTGEVRPPQTVTPSEHSLEGTVGGVGVGAGPIKVLVLVQVPLMMQWQTTCKWLWIMISRSWKYSKG